MNKGYYQHHLPSLKNEIRKVHMLRVCWEIYVLRV